MITILAFRSFYEEALTIYLHEYPSGSHPTLALQFNNMALICRDEGSLEEAESLQQRAVTIHESCCGRRHPDTGNSGLVKFLTAVLFHRFITNFIRIVGNLGLILIRKGDQTKGAALINEALESLRAGKLSEEHPWIQKFTKELATLRL